MEKKNPYVTTIGFNKDDPDHVRVAELLNSMGRGKAQYIVKAVLAYQCMQENGQVPQMVAGPVDYDMLRRMVFQILDEKDRQKGITYTDENSPEPVTKQPEENDMLRGLDDTALNGMMASILAFQGQ